MNRSSEYGFYLPQNTDPISVNDFNYNFDVIDDNMLSKNEQTLTSTQKSQVKSNLGFANQTDLDALDSKITNLVIAFGTSSKDLTSNLTDNWSTAVPNDSRVYFVRINSMYGAFYGVICRYSDVYGTGIVSRYDGRVYRIQMNNGSCSSYQLQNRPIEVLSTGSKTISANGNISYTFSNKVLVLGVYSTSSDIVCSAYPSSGADSSGSAEWWIHCRNANSSGSVASGTITCYIIYIDMA